jgi:hypothetical protein
MSDDRPARSLRADDHIGDRVERAIDQRADVEHKIERGEAAEPAPGRLRRGVFGSR